MILSNLLKRKIHDDEIKLMTYVLVIHLAPLIHQKNNEKNYQEEIK